MIGPLKTDRCIVIIPSRTATTVRDRKIWREFWHGSGAKVKPWSQFRA
jgi:hypothetical protein